MARRIIHWWIAYFLGGVAIVILCFSLGAILYVAALTANGLNLTDRVGTIVMPLIITVGILFIICMLFATYMLFLDNSEKGIRNISPFHLRSFLQWWVGGLIYSTNPSNVLNDFIGFRRK